MDSRNAPRRHRPAISGKDVISPETSVYLPKDRRVAWDPGLSPGTSVHLPGPSACLSSHRLRLPRRHRDSSGDNPTPGTPPRLLASLAGTRQNRAVSREVETTSGGIGMTPGMALRLPGMAFRLPLRRPFSGDTAPSSLQAGPIHAETKRWFRRQDDLQGERPMIPGAGLSFAGVEPPPAETACHLPTTSHLQGRRRNVSGDGLESRESVAS